MEKPPNYHYWKIAMIGLILAVSARGKLSDRGKDSYMGWPNFFNPKQSILREHDLKENSKQEKYHKDGGGSISPGETPSETSHDLNNSENEEDLIDYTLKGGLRGTYILLNSTSNIHSLEEDTQKTIIKILKQDEKLFREVDSTIESGETTEEGVRLRTPLIMKTHSKALGKYGSRISFFTGEEKPLSMMHFGNWCGRGGRSAPIDNIDNCCLEQEKCYGKMVRQCPDVWRRPYRFMYAWAILDGDPVCVRSDSTCVNSVCECDREAALCLRYFSQNPREVPLHMNVSPHLTKRSEKKLKGKLEKEEI